MGGCFLLKESLSIVDNDLPKHNTQQIVAVETPEPNPQQLNQPNPKTACAYMPEKNLTICNPDRGQQAC